MSARTPGVGDTSVRATQGDLPGCDAGPAGRLLFVVRELSALCRSRHRSTTSGTEVAAKLGRVPQ